MHRRFFTAAILSPCCCLQRQHHAQHTPTDFPADRIQKPAVQGPRSDRCIPPCRCRPGYATDGGLHAPSISTNSSIPCPGFTTPGALSPARQQYRQGDDLCAAYETRRLEAAEGRVLSAEDADLVMRISGVDQVLPVPQMVRSNWPVRWTAAPEAAPAARRGQPPAAIFAEFSPAENQGQSRGELAAAEIARINDPWDATGSRQRLVELLRARHPQAEVKNLNPILDEMRSVKSPREIAMVRRASQIAGLGLMEAMRSAEPGVRSMSSTRRHATSSS